MTLASYSQSESQVGSSLRLHVFRVALRIIIQPMVKLGSGGESCRPWGRLGATRTSATEHP
jgi:hypothetical protein